MLATLWYPDTNPIGAGSLWPLGIVVGYAAIAWVTRWRALTYAAPVLFAIAAVKSGGFPFGGGRRFPDMDDFVGYYVWNLAADCFALHVARSGSRGSLIYGGVVLFPLGWLLVIEVIARGAPLAAAVGYMNFQQGVLWSLVVWCPIFAVMMVRAAEPFRRAGRVSRGLCGRCGYDMRESPERCPECGEIAAGSAPAS